MNNDIYLIIAAGGRGLRIGGNEPKQFRKLSGMSILEYTVRAFLALDIPKITGITLAVPKDYVEQVSHWQLSMPIQVISGGATRQESVYLAINALPNVPNAIVLIHDAVRPFPPLEPIQEAIKALDTWDGATLGESSFDTLKRIDKNGKIIKTEPREEIFRAQTPQVARLHLWHEAFAWAKSTGFQATDDVSLLEALGKKIKMIPAPTSNLKLTTTEDWNYISQKMRL
jgi:2-C-methyl-D-erythritol 4-phosphate cytidylyltransferase